MRIIAGTYRSRVLEAPAGLATRPTSDRLRETLFNVLAPRMAGAAFLDLYAGSGAVSLEALSRGAARVVSVERAQPALKALRANLMRLGAVGAVSVQAMSVAAYLERAAERFGIVFLDPPYDAEAEYAATLGWLGAAIIQPRSPSARDLGHPFLEADLGHPFLEAGAMVIAEHRRKEQLPEQYGALTRTRLLEQGDAALSFYRRVDGEA
ncbi:MAG TPA: 16S rRNA (guanine(966)-N(2))-methyltransferase RsmD [Terracidiphilus sp.]|jgi:16S rRNA (guanine(966)-N(2))-methyltransferase RsmD|nr:16S rRNA (guanine(966)-N(2))-methyltransferase RsmD [Terracidiphilus sp.]